MEGINSSQILKPRKRGREPDDSMQAQRRRPQGRDNREQAVDEGPSALARITISNGTRASEQPVISNMGNQDELDELNEEIATDYAKSRELYNRKTIVVDINFVSKIAEIIDEDSKPKSMAECRERLDCVQWKEAVETELRSLNKRQVFWPVAHTPPKVFSVGYKWVFVRKRNEDNVVVRYKARFVAQGFSQIPEIDYDETYSPVMSGITSNI